MKNLFFPFLLAAGLAVVAAPASAQTIRRVNNTGVTGPNIYATIEDAVTAASAGDIIQVEPSETTYGGGDINKSVRIIGPGYFLGPDYNPGLQANPTTAKVSYLNLYVSGTIAEGLDLGSIGALADNVTIRRCRIQSALYVGYQNTVNNVVIRQNWIGFLQENGSNATNLTVANNISGNVTLGLSSNGTFYNNTVPGGSLSISNFLIYNNYLYGGLSGVNNTVNNNFAYPGGSLPTGNGNQTGIDPADIFRLTPGATQFDAWFLLKTGTNPASTGGVGGAQIGAFGGVNPYKLSGIPAVPTIYQQTQTINGNQLNVNLSTRSNN